MHCPRCANEAGSNAVFCSQCGAAFTRVCSNCERRCPLDASFCADCGTALAADLASDSAAPGVAPHATGAPDGERRRVTILLSDLTGYTALNEALDPEDVAAILEEIKSAASRIVERHGGIVNQFVGDQVTALFGVPTSHDDDPRRSVDAALEIHATVHTLSARRNDSVPLLMHTSIQSGLVVAQRRDQRDGMYAITGDAMEQANHLLSFADSDQVVVGAGTHPLIAPYFESEPISQRGDEPAAFRVLGGKRASSRFEAAQARGLTPLMGREYELGRLHAAYQDTLAGRGHAVAVVGEPGVGKSRLLHEFRESIDPDEAFVFYGRCQSYGGVTAYLPFLQAFRDALGMGQSETPEQVAERVVRIVLDLDPELERYLPIYLHVLSTNSEAYPLTAEMQGEALPQWIQDAIVAINRQLSLQRPVVLHLEDWHWADESSEATLVRFAREIADARIMIVVDYRPHYRPRWGDFNPEVVRLQPLPPDAERDLIVRCLGADEVDDALAALVQERTGGNPLFVEEVCAALSQAGELEVVHGRVRASGPLDSLSLPETVQSVVRSRIDRLSEPARELLRLASVIGREFPTLLLEKLAGPGPALAARLAELERFELLQAWPVGGERGSRFKHVTTQEVSYGTLLRQKRTVLHCAVGEALEEVHAGRLTEHVEELARQFSLGGDDEKALEYLTHAARKSARNYALGQARRHYHAAIDRIDPEDSDPERVRRRVGLVLRWAEVCIYDPAVAQLEQLGWARQKSETLGRPDQVLRSDYWIAWIHYAIGDQTRAIEGAERAVAQARRAGDDDQLGLMLCSLGQCYVIGRDHARARELLLEGIALRKRAAEKGGYDVGGTFGYALSQLGLLEGDAGRFEESASWFREALATARNVGRQSAEGSILTALGMVQSIRGDHSGALTTALDFRRIALHMSAPYLYASSETLEGIARFHLGEVDAGLALMRSAVEKLDACGAHLTLTWSLGCLAEGLALSGRFESAISHANRALARATVGDRLGDSFARRVLALAEARRPGGSLDKARNQLAEAIGFAAENEPERLLAELFGARIATFAGETSAARTTLQRIVPALEGHAMTSYAENGRRLLERLG